MADNTSQTGEPGPGASPARSEAAPLANDPKTRAAKRESNTVTSDEQWSERVQAQLDWLASPAMQRRPVLAEPSQPQTRPDSIAPNAEKPGLSKSDTLKPDDEGVIARLRNRFLQRKSDDIAPSVEVKPEPQSADLKSEPKVAGPKRELVDDIEGALKARYTVVAFDQGKKINLFEQGTEKPVISINAQAISTTMDKGAVVKDVVTLARDRGWDTLKVSGTPTFKDEVWLEASKQRIKAQHEPSPRVQVEYDKWKAAQPNNAVELGKADVAVPAVKKADLGQVFSDMTPEQRIADPKFRNAQLELMIANGIAEKETGKKIGQTPDIERALVAVVAAQIRSGKVFDAPFLKPTEPVQSPSVQRQAQSATQTKPIEQTPLRQ